MKKYMAVWGNWQNYGNTYKPEVRLLMMLEHFSAEQGYSQKAMDAVRELQPGQVYYSDLGNHFIVRLPDEIGAETIFIQK